MSSTNSSMRSVVLIEVCSTSPNYISPWKMHSQKSCKGSGFVIEGRRIMTNFHVVQDAIDVRLRKHGVSRRWRGKVLVEAHDVDLALLTVHEEEEGNGDSFWQDVKPAMWCDALPSLQSPVHVVGFPTGGQTISVTQGVVSRIDCKNYRIGYTHRHAPGGLLVLQIDAAINPGNSGGPAFDADGRVVGVAFQSLGGQADGIGYLIPAIVCRNLLAALSQAPATLSDAADSSGGARASHERYIYPGLPDIPFSSRELRNASLRRRHHVPPNVTGVLITKVSPITNLDLRVDDVVTHIDSKAIGDDGTVELRDSELVSADFLMTCKPPETPTTFSVLREGDPLECSGVLRPLPHVLPRSHGFDCEPEYLIIGGLVFMRLTCPMLENKQHKQHSMALFELIHYQLALNFAQQEPAEQVLVLTEILTTSLNYGYNERLWRVLDTLNGQSVPSLRALAKMSAEYDGEFFEFVFSHGGDKIVLDAKQCREIEPEILRMHAIPAIASKRIISARQEVEQQWKSTLPSQGNGA